jgi:hypothetical protein
LAGELIVYDDLRKFKIGDGTTKVNDLPFSSVDLTDAISYGEGLIIDEINKHLELNPAYTAIYYDPVFDGNGHSTITGRTGLMTPD